jgi:hypothetical protein
MAHPLDETVDLFHAAFSTWLDGLAIKGLPGMILRYIRNPLTALDQSDSSYQDMPDIKLVEKRLALLYNTLWKAGWVYPSTMSGKFNVTIGAGQDAYGVNRTDGRGLLITTSTTIFLTRPVYALNRPWVMIYFISVGVMFLAAVSSLVLYYRCHILPILGFVSSLTRDSKYFEGVQGNSYEDGTKRAKRLRAMGVKIVNVQGNDVVGKIAFAPAQEGLRVRRKRWYE